MTTTNTKTNKNNSKIPFGMSSFTHKEREQFGQSVRLAMSCIEGSSEPVKANALPSDENNIRKRLKILSQEMTSQHADLLELLVRFDDLQGWKSSGASHCAAWMNVEVGISMQLSWEYLRVGRKLQSLPTLKALFRVGKLSWSKVRLISRVADQDNEPLLCHAALDASVSDVKRLCQNYRWNNDDNDEAAKNDQALKQWETRSLTWNEASNGSTCIQLVLPPEIAQAFLNSVEHSLSQVETKDNKMSQRRADSAVLMAETSLQSAGKAIATADRYQVIVSVDATDLPTAQSVNTPGNISNRKISKTNTPKKHPTVRSAGPIAVETARRISCDCSLSVHNMVNGEPADIGRKSRIWPSAMERAIKERDQHCIWPGCTQSRHLHIHHIKHWADGGATSVDNGACLCSHHHTMVHEGGFTIQRVDNNDQRLMEQFVQHQHSNDTSMFEFESTLRNSKKSFAKVRKLLPTRYRFRVINAQGQNILVESNAGFTDAQNCSSIIRNDSHQPYNLHQSHENTRVECREPLQGCYYSEQNDTYAQLCTYEMPPKYVVSNCMDNSACY